MPLEALERPVALALEGLETIPECLGREAVLVFGSHARRQSSTSSDVDLLVIGKHVERVYRDFPGFSLDLICETRESVLDKLKKQDRWNNHFLLNILTDAQIVWDPSEVGRSLMETAARRRARGPAAMTGAEARQAERAITIMLRSAKAEPERLRIYTVEQRTLCRMRLDQVVSRAIYLNFKARRRWSSSFPHSVLWIERQEPELYRLWRHYAEASLEQAPMAAAAIVTFTLGCLREIE